MTNICYDGDPAASQELIPILGSLCWLGDFPLIVPKFASLKLLLIGSHFAFYVQPEMHLISFPHDSPGEPENPNVTFGP